MQKYLSSHSTAIYLILVSWLFYGAMTNTKDLNTYGLYQAGAESIVEFHTFTLGHSKIPELRDSGDGDIFEYEHQRFAAKQPGVFLLNAIPYFFLHHVFSLNYETNYDLVASIGVWTTVAFLAALSVGVFFELLLLLGLSPPSACFGAVAYGLGSTLFPYTGIPHHDVAACSFIVFAIYLIKSHSKLLSGRSLYAGICLGLVLFFSMLPALIVAVIIAYALLHFNRIHFARFIGGFFIGNLPLAIYNTYYFGKVWNQANLAGNYQDTFFSPNWDLFHRHLYLYFSISSGLSVTKYMPVILLGLVGCVFWQRNYWREKILVIGAFSLHLTYLLCIPTDGHCQFGPRYFIPLIPLCLLGFGNWFKPGSLRIISAPIAFVTLVFSMIVNFAGAFGNTMYCDLLDFGLTKYWSRREILFKDHFLLWPSCLSLILMIFIFWKGTKSEISNPSTDL